ncbi:8-amino-7-oxononanoate synthase [Corynebacterium lipophiloflavum]|uniref:8-amino-7-oxononanoate synthase n=1 Tax=Corynebacterium lipophiloflavum (strain ATCC 700352 / DSM 44291 / CCUG 37336 / JCM 10383 / DMMZ 1944) TaxID=525263 RepID=C0XR82_CORLD|nr:8-amino-7-oxononanoate synthase [Corynebacterium lipophiloflavum]EEI17216.1 8-amino-7-oxononanoate synthase [Corynebacterium lipophiloflavum DSM 44291]
MEAESPSRALDWLDEESRRRSAAGLHRVLRPRSPEMSLLDLASNDYLGLSRHPEVIAGARRSLERCGAGATGSRLVTGTLDEHDALERELAQFCGQPSALVFSSGYMANLGLVTALSGRGALVVSDAGSHASLIDACRLSRARVVVTPRGDVDAVAEALKSRAEPRAVVLTDSVYSTDGALAPVAELHAAAREHGAVLVVDEAHGFGVRGAGGRGYVHELGLAGQEDLVVSATLSKALGAQGGVVFSSPRVRAHLVDTARSFIFDTALAPPMVGAARAALSVLQREPERAARVLNVASQLVAATNAAAPESAVVSVVLGDSERAVAARDAARDRGLEVGCFRPPSVPAGTSRLRLTARADLSDAEVSRAALILRDIVEEYSHL